MGRLANADANNKTIISILAAIAFGLIIALLYAIYVIQTTRENFTLSIPPAIGAGVITRPDQFDAATVYAFVSRTVRALNRWENDGAVDYLENIRELTPRFTAEYRDYLLLDANARSADGELANRTRYALEVPGTEIYTEDNTDLVQPISANAWRVNLELTFVERIANFEFKEVSVRYPFIVRRGNISPEKNVWGLVIDGYAEGETPEIIETRDIALEIQE